MIVCEKFTGKELTGEVGKYCFQMVPTWEPRLLRSTDSGVVGVPLFVGA